jgi:hypothetical protein
VSSQCYSSIKGLAMRATRLDSSGKWVTGSSAAAVSEGFVTINLSADVEDGEKFMKKNAAGKLCINDKDKPRLLGINLEIEFCEVDPQLFELMTGVRILETYAGKAAGFTMAEEMAAAPHALEVWTKVAGNPTDGLQWIYWLLPFVENGIVGDFNIENGPMSFKMKANTETNPYWGVGPYDVVAIDSNLTAGVLLDPVESDEHLYHRLTEIAPPTAQCGYVALNVPWAA